MYEKLKAELDDALEPGSIPTWDQVKDLPYLYAVIHEGQAFYSFYPSKSIVKLNYDLACVTTEQMLSVYPGSSPRRALNVSVDGSRQV